MANFDFAVLDAHTRALEGTDLQIVHPATRSPIECADGSPLVIRLKGRTSDEYREVERRVRDRRAEKQARQIRLTYDDIEQEEIDYLTAATVSWNFDELDGKPFPCTPGNARKLWSDLRFRWVRESALVHVMNDASFLAKSSLSSSSTPSGSSSSPSHSPKAARSATVSESTSG